MEDIKRFEHEGLTVRIQYDPNPENPREWDNLGTMVFFHKRRNVGDKHTFTVEELREYVKRDDVIALPVYAYDHSCFRLSTTRNYPFNCQWDSGQLGYICIEREKALKEFGKKRLTAALHRKVEDGLRSEVAVYDKYLNGEFVGFVIENAEGEHLDSCWGFDALDYCEEQAKESAERIAASAKEAERLCAE